MIRRPPRSPLFPSPPLSRPEPEDLGRDLAGERRQSRSREHDLVPAPAGARRELARRRGRELPQQAPAGAGTRSRSEEHTSELQSQSNLVCRLLLEKKKKK